MDGERNEKGVRDALVHAAKLAHLDLSDDAQEALCADALRILGHIETMREMDLGDVEPLVHPLDGAGVMRDDEPGGALDRDGLMGMAPAAHPPFVRVPKVIDGGGAS
ncbi:MAG: Asp-tRNA(Asn)/Glu-tRNA(Gln) amidotransferase subunit GatC [Planctomycetota bacterium]